MRKTNRLFEPSFDRLDNGVLDSCFGEAAQIVNQVHSCPDPTKLPFPLLVYEDAIPIRTKIQLHVVSLPDARRYVGGHYILSDDPRIPSLFHNGGPGIVINTNRTRSSWTNSLLHEYWHFIEEHVGKAEGCRPKCIAALQQLSQEVTKTAEYRQILADYDFLKDSAITLGDALANEAAGAAEVTREQVDRSKVLLKITAYHVQVEEWVARCYVQWVATNARLDCCASILDKLGSEKTVTGLPIYLQSRDSLTRVSRRFEDLFKHLDCTWS